MVQQRRGQEVVGQGAVVVGLHLAHGRPEQRHVVLDGRLHHGLVHLVVDVRHLREGEVTTVTVYFNNPRFLQIKTTVLQPRQP